MALIVPTSNLIPKPSLTFLSSQHKQKTKTQCLFKSKLFISSNTISKHSFTPKEKNNSTPKTQTPFCKYGDSSSNTHDENNPVSESDPQSNRIWWSEVEVKRPKKVFVKGRKWNVYDIENLVGAIIFHGLVVFAPFTFNWGAFWVAVVLCVVTGMLGITLSYHRNLTHRSFKLPKWLEYTFAYCGVLAMQRDPIFWVSTHRHHHQFVDTDQDPHSPREGFWFSQINWLLDNGAIVEKCGEQSNVQDLEKQPFYRFIRNTYFLHPFLLGVLLYAIGGFPYVVWGMGVRSVWYYHATGLVNSVCHVWGNRPWNSGDLSTNNWFVAILTFGEGWHNNHHAFEYSARHGFEWWQIDMTWYTIKLLEFLGLAKDVKLPTEDQKRHRLAVGSE